MTPTTHAFLEGVFSGSEAHGLRFVSARFRGQLKLKGDPQGTTSVWCLKREKWLRAKPEEVVRQLFRLRTE